MLRLSPSQSATYRDCPRKYMFRYYLGRVPTVEDDSKIGFGKAWDKATGEWWAGGLEAAVAWLISQAGKLDEIEAAKIAVMLKHYNPPHDRFEFVGNQVPAEFRPKGMRGVRVLNFCDTLLRDRFTGELVVRECKTTSRDITGFGPYWQRLQTDGQVGSYFHAFVTDRIYYDVSYRPQIKLSASDTKAAAYNRLGWELSDRKLNAEQQREFKAAKLALTHREEIDAYQARLEAAMLADPMKYYQWRPIDCTVDSAAEAMQDICQQARTLRDAWRLLRWPRNSNHCINVYGTCEYLDVCSGRADINDDGLFRAKSKR